MRLMLFITTLLLLDMERRCENEIRDDDSSVLFYILIALINTLLFFILFLLLLYYYCLLLKKIMMMAEVAVPSPKSHHGSVHGRGRKRQAGA